MRTSLKLLLGSILAMMLGLAVASPILVKNLELGGTVNIKVDVVYAYFVIQGFDRNITGLWRNLTDPFEGEFHVISYLIVLNVTNHSDGLATIGEFEASAAEEILVTNGTDKIGSEELARTSNRSVTRNGQPMPLGFGVEMENTIVMDYRDLSEYYPGWSQYWSANSSRLIVLSGMRSIATIDYGALTNGTIYLYGEVKGQPFGGSSKSLAFSLKLAHLQRIGREYLFNSLLSDDELLQVDSNGLDAHVEVRR
jgi:hypothetical protein